MATLKGSRKLESGRLSKASRFQPFVVFILSKKIKVPIRRFMFLDESELQLMDEIVEDFYNE